MRISFQYYNVITPSIAYISNRNCVYYSYSANLRDRNSSIPNSNYSNESQSRKSSNGEDMSGPYSGSSSRRHSRLGSRKNSHRPQNRSRCGSDAGSPGEAPVIQQYRVAMLGASEVGKSALTSQFLSSDHMNTYDTVGTLY